MPKGVRGFQPGRDKTGGRTKGGSIKNSKKFVDQLQRFGLNVARELARGVMAIEDPVLRFHEVRRLLPYLVPELKPIDLVDDTDEAEGSISTDLLMEAMNNNGRKDTATAKPKSSPVSVVEEGSAPVEAPASTEDNLRNVDKLEESNP